MGWLFKHYANGPVIQHGPSELVVLGTACGHLGAALLKSVHE